MLLPTTFYQRGEKMILQDGLYSSLVVSGIDTTTLGVLYVLFAVIVGVIGYLLGSINTSIITSKLVYHDDIRKYGSGNAGMTNMLRTFGGKAAIMTLVGDLLKTVIAILVGGLFLGLGYVGGISTGVGGYIGGFFAILGHVFPIYYKFKGGKGVLATATMALVLTPVAFVFLFIIFALIVWKSRYVSLGSITVASLYPVVVNAYFKIRFTVLIHPIVALITILLAILIVWCHRTNIVRISNRTESKLSFGKKNKDKESKEENNDGTGEG
jgi:glycerol-3-phosphate acyltransferase PlsY